MKKNVMRWLVFLFFLTIVPVIVIGFISLRAFNLRVENEILQSLSSSGENYARILDDQIIQTYSLANSVHSQNQVEKIANPHYTMKKYEEVVNVNVAIELLTNVKRSLPIIKNVALYLGKSEKIYNSNGNPKGSQVNFNKTDYDELLELRKIPLSLYWYNNHLVMLTYSSLKNPLSICEVKLDNFQLEKSLLSSLLYEKSFYILALQNQNGVLTNISDLQLQEQVLMLPWVKDTPTNKALKLTYEGTPYYAFRSELPSMGASYYKVIPYWQLFSTMGFSSTYALLFSLVVLIGTIVFLIGANRIIHKPLKQLVATFENVKRNGFEVRMDPEKTTEFAYLYEGFNSMAEYMDVLIEKEYQSKILLQKAELKQLQAQINPHFLYNSFFMLHHKINRGIDDEAKEIARLLGTYFQYITRSHTDFVSLKDEYQHAIMYATIQGCRFEGRIQVETAELPESYEAIQVPKLIIQPILENAFNYGMENKVSDGLLRIYTVANGNILHIHIEDNGDELTDECLNTLRNGMMQIEESYGSIEPTGLLNIYKRLQIYYQRTDIMSIDRSTLGGLSVTLHLFALKGEQNDVPIIDCR